VGTGMILKNIASYFFTAQSPKKKVSRKHGLKVVENDKEKKGN